ncbi:MAG: NFACT family protein, partial [Oscillospiraceae bacterium]|nr:NFACT family protein [Oscillospiraceae bacterium]
MSLDGGFLHIVKTEISKRIPIGARVDKIHQPSRDEVVLTFRIAGVYQRLLFSANAMSARVCLTDIAPENPPVPPMFCLMLRKHIGNGRITGMSQDGLERILNFDFAASNELGEPVNIRLMVEIMGRTSNVILVNADNGKIIDSIKRVTDEISKTRRILPNLDYAPPPKDSTRLCLLNCDIEHTDLAMNDKALLKQLEGISPLFAREAVYYADGSQARLKQFLHKAKTALTENSPEITLISDLDKKPRDFCFMPITQYGSEMLTSRCESANELLEKFFREKAGAERIKQRSGNIMKTLNTAYERLLRKIENQKLELVECKNREEIKIYGDLINANLCAIQKTDEFLETEHYITGETVKIKLDSRLTPAQNAQKYYSAYRKLSTAEKMLTKLIQAGEQELLYLDSVIDAASRATTDFEVSEIRAELKGTPRSDKYAKKQKQSKPLPPLKFTATDGTEILIGRNNKQNDELTFKTAKPDDIWLHTKDIAGSHTILRCSGRFAGAPPIETITEAAELAAEHSKGRESSRV